MHDFFLSAWITTGPSCAHGSHGLAAIMIMIRRRTATTGKGHSALIGRQISIIFNSSDVLRPPGPALRLSEASYTDRGTRKA
jgi:hypothetical protein